MKPKRHQPFGFGLADSLLAEVGGRPLDALHRDVDAICTCYDRIQAVADRLGIASPKPRLAGFAYSHVSALGAGIVFAKGSEPNVVPLIRRLEDIDRLAEPEDYLSCGVVPERLDTLEQLLERRPDAVKTIGHQFEGPVTTAALLIGQDFFMLPYDDPERAHRLMSFSADSSIHYARAIRERLGESNGPRPVGIPDDFAGMFSPPMFGEYVAPYWDRVYTGLDATRRSIHSELLRKDHLPYLKQLNIAVFDPSADQYVTPELLKEHCPVPFTARLQGWHIRYNSASQLQKMYRHLASLEPVSISFYMGTLEEEVKIKALLEVARELA